MVHHRWSVGRSLQQIITVQECDPLHRQLLRPVPSIELSLSSAAHVHLQQHTIMLYYHQHLTSLLPIFSVFVVNRFNHKSSNISPAKVVIKRIYTRRTVVQIHCLIIDICLFVVNSCHFFTVEKRHHLITVDWRSQISFPRCPLKLI